MTSVCDSTRGEAAMYALVLVVVVFVAWAPPPLNEPLNEKANAPAMVSAVIEAVSYASRTIPPVVALTSVLAFWIDASTVLPMVFSAVATAIAIAAPSGAMLAATAIEAVFAVIFEVSRAERRMLAAVIPVAAVPSPSMVALTSAAILFEVVAPA